MKDIHLWKFIRTGIKNHDTVALTIVVDSEKGSPGKQGFKMAVTRDRVVHGSIGGGIMEFNHIRDAIRILESGEQNIPVKPRKIYHNKRASVKKSGLICAGSQTNVLLILNKKDLPAVEKIVHASEKREEAIFTVDRNGLGYSDKDNLKEHSGFKFKKEGNWRYDERVGSKETVVIAGCGHVGLAVSRQMSMLGFNVLVIDDRKDHAFIAKNKFADEIITGSYSKLGKIADKYPGAYYIIVTSGFITDKQALKAIINKKVRYIGIMGTTAKLKKIFFESVKEGVSRTLLKKVKAPIGLDINSDTPEEIAVSIAAEIIKDKNMDSN